MLRTVPFEVFDDFEQPVFVTGENESVEYLNHSAATFFGVDPQGLAGRRCHEVFGLCSPAGEALCRKGGCPVQWQARNGRLPQTLPAVFASPRAAPVNLTVWAFALSPPRLGRAAVLHMITVVNETIQDSDTSFPIPKAAGALIKKLSPREVDVLRELALGHTTEEVAEALFVSTTTVRNHIHHILEKLGVHRRMDAVLAWVRLRKRGRTGARAV